MSGELIHRATLEELLGWRERTLELYGEAFDLHADMTARLNAKLKEVQAAAARATSGTGVYIDKAWEKRTGEREKYDLAARHCVDRAMWQSLLTLTGMGSLMDAKARSDFESTLASEPPEITSDNVRATFRQMKADAARIFRRGVVNVFKELSREYRSHDGFKIGHRIIMGYILSECGSFHHGARRDELIDADRIMHVLDGHKIHEGWSSPLAAAIESGARGNFSTGLQPGSADTEYWHIKWFKNRNAHLYPKRKDLLRRVNRLIADHFGDAVGEGPDTAWARKYTRAKPHHSQVEDFYPTPPAVVELMIRVAQMAPGMDVLEPEAGEGAVVEGILAAGLIPDCVEIDPDRVDILGNMLPPGAVINRDFLAMDPEPEYDRILMNPPWGKLAGVAHVFHAIRFLKPGGRLVAILGAGLEYREDGPTRELRKLVADWRGRIERLPSGSFKESGTMVDAVMLIMDKPSSHCLSLANDFFGSAT